jgi:beta-glucosidase
MKSIQNKSVVCKVLSDRRKSAQVLIWIAGIVLIFSGLISCKFHSQNSDPIETKVDDLLSQMTLEEKVDLVGGLGFKTKAIERLGIPEIVMTDGGIGPNRSGKSTN